MDNSFLSPVEKNKYVSIPTIYIKDICKSIVNMYLTRGCYVTEMKTAASVP